MVIGSRPSSPSPPARASIPRWSCSTSATAWRSTRSTSRRSSPARARDFEVTEDQPEPLDALIARVQCPVLGVFGEADFLISLDDVRGFRDALERHRKSYHIKIFAGMPHGWLNDTMPGRYRPKEAEEAWRLGIDFLQRVDSGQYPPDRVHWLFES